MLSCDVLHFIYLFIFLALRAKISICQNDLEPPVVLTRNGKIEGTWKISEKGRFYAAFKGIPYAKPPVGNLRFKEPKPNEPWIGTWKATVQTECPQVNLAMTSDPYGEEDCLYLDVFVPKTEGLKNLDVLVHIHGGAFHAGNSASYIDPKHLMDRDWILVSMNYRLGALGFLSTGDDVISGNNGHKDQVLALKWIRDNIASFGGNSNSVTITGFSSGAGSVHLHYFSPLSKGLYHRGWSFSGSALSPWAIVENPLEQAQKLATALGCNISSNEEMVNCLQQKPASSIVKKTVETMFPVSPAPFCPFAAVIEKGSSNPFLVEHPYKLLEAGQAHDVPWIASNTVEDGLFMATIFADRFEIIEEKWTELAKYLFDYVSTSPPSRETTIAEKIKKFYLSNRKFEQANIELIGKMFTDRYFEDDIENAAQLQAKTSRVYFSKFTYEGTNGWKQYHGIDYDKGTVHGDDMVYYFGGLITKPMTNEEKQLKEICLDTLYSFATTGSPVIKDAKWIPISDEFVYLNISGPNIIQMEVKRDFSSNQFWKDLNLLENEHIFKEKDEL